MITVRTHHPVALDSPDHLHPRGTKNDNTVNLEFNRRVRDVVGAGARLLDLGCAGGGLVRSLVDQGHLAVGIEGSDYSKVRGRAEWRDLADTHLFTADITKPFFVSCGWFNVITLWEVIEHIKEEDLPGLFENIGRHLQTGGFVLMSVSPNEDEQDGVAIHQCVHEREWWEEKFRELGWVSHPEIVAKFSDVMVRGDSVRVEDGQITIIHDGNAPGSFHFALMREA